MFKNYFKITIRNLVKHKASSFINIIGLAIGMACCLCISLWVLDELSYERFNENSERIYLVTVNYAYSDGKQISSRTSAPLCPTLMAEFSDIEIGARHRELNTMLIRYQNKVFFESNISTVDPSFFSIFSFPFVIGNKDTALNQPNSVVISQDIAHKYFGNDNPLGKALTFNNSDNYIVNGVIENVPGNSHLQFDIVLPWSYMKKISWYDENYWSSGFLETYVLLEQSANPQGVREKIKDLYKKHIDNSIAEISLFPIVDIHLYSHFFRSSSSGNIKYVFIFTAIALLVLLIACVNFMNLSTAKSSNRSKEIGFRKVAGANKSQIVRQFFGESILMAFMALVFAVFLLIMFLPHFNSLTGKQISLFGTVNTGVLLMGLAATALITGIISGSYPALYLSSFQPVQIFRGSLSKGIGGGKFRKPLVIFQFCMSIFLIIVSFIVVGQLRYMLNMDVGWNKDHLLYVNMRSGPLKEYPLLKSKLKNDFRINGVSATQSLPTYFGNSSSNVNWEGKDPNQKIFANFTSVDFDFIKTLKIEMAEGRSFSKEFMSDLSNGAIINQEFKRKIGRKSVVGLQLDFNGDKRRVVGVAKDFHIHSARDKIEPAIMILSDKSLHYMIVRINSSEISSALSFLEKTWKELIPQFPLVYTFFDEQIERSYHRESYMGHLLGYSAFLAVLIACLGLYGLVSFTAEKRTKEIGIRKVLGASNHSIVALLSIEFIKPVLIANLIAWPIAYYTGNSWIQQFAHRDHINILLFLLAGGAAMLIAFIAVSYQSVRAARANPIKAIKYE